MRNLVTGAAGFIGSQITERLIQNGEKVIGIDNLHENYSTDIKKHNLQKIRQKADKDQFKLVQGSINNTEDLQQLPKDFESVFHAAAVPGVRESVKNPEKYFKTNAYGTANLLNYIQDMEKLVFTSSSSVYGEVPEEQLPVSEDRKLNPKAPYPLSKKQAEETVRQYAELQNFDYSILRLFTVYGKRQRPDEAFTKFISMILNGEEVTIYGDGEQSRDFTHVEDVVDACMKASKKNRRDTYNISTGRRITVNQMVDTIDRISEQEVKRKYVEQPEADVRHTHADISKAKQKIGYQPTKEFEEGVKECLSWVKQMKKENLL